MAGHVVFQQEWFRLIGSLIGALLVAAGSVVVIGFSLLVATIPAEEIER